MSKLTFYGNDARAALLRGIDFLVDAVALTEGPRGRNVVLGQRNMGQTPKVTRDGVTTANYVDPSDPTEQLGADLIREACQKTDNVVGDGTTSTAVLARAMIRAGFRMIEAGANPMAMELGIRKAASAVSGQLKKMAVVCDDQKVLQVATVSAHGDTEIGALVAKAVIGAGRDGIVTAEPSSTSDTTVETVAGIELEKSNLISPIFITHPEDMKAELLDCRILLWEGTIASAKSVVPILRQVADPQSTTPLIIIAGGYEAEALACIINNKSKLALPLIAVRMEAYGDRRKEVMRDIAALVGGKAYTEDMGLKIENIKLSDLGQARRVTTTMSRTQIVGGKGSQEELTGRIQHIRNMLDSTYGEEAKILRKRLAALLGGITVIKVGGTTVTEMEEKKDRVVDAMSAAKAAVEDGVVAGGGTAIFNASYILAHTRKVTPVQQLSGIDVVHEACRAVVQQIAENAGIDGDLLVNQLGSAPDIGYNAMTDKFENLIESGIIDPVKVVCESLRNASAVSCSIITMGACVSEIKQEKPNV